MRLAQSKVHFVGIGGIGMCGLAELLHNMGAQVTGSDLSENMQTQRLKELGVTVFRGHVAENVHTADVVVYSSAVKPSNPEYREALRLKIPLIRRAEALAELMRLKRGVAVAGSHGKTTTTSLTAACFLAGGHDPTLVVGGRLDWLKSTSQLGKGEWLIAEADESDGSFNRLSPETVIITNIDNDHLDHYGSFENLKHAFLDFASRIPFYGSAIVCGDDENIRSLFRDFGKKLITYGTSETNDYVLSGGPRGWSVSRDGQALFQFHLPMPGTHNALNALAAMIAAHQAGMDFEEAKKGVESFRGVDRRFQHKAQVKDIDFYDDYGHHPTEIKAVLRGFRDKFPDRRLVVLFQPHRFSRTRLCWDQFLNCFGDCDRLFVTDIYVAGEAPIEGVHSTRLSAEIQHPSCVYLSREKDGELSAIRTFLKSGDIFLTLGAGDVYRLGERMMEDLAKTK